MLSRLQAIVALFMLLILAAPAAAQANPEESQSARPGLQMADVVDTFQSVLDEHPAPPDAAFLLRAGMRGAVRQMESLGILGERLFAVPLTGALAGDADAVEQVLDSLLAGRTQEERSQVIFAGLAEALASLDDPGTHLYGPGQYGASLEELGYSLGGVGFFVDEEKDSQGRLVIVEMFEGFPAERQGIRPGDRLVAVAGHPTRDLTFNELIDIIRGPVGTRITLSIQRGDGPVKEYNLTREWLNPNPKGIESHLVQPGIAYIKVKYLGHRIHHEVRQQLGGLVAQGARGLVLDLRNCPGVPAGAVGLAGLFLPAGKVVMVEVTQDDEISLQTSGPAGLDLPVVVLINRYSSGAAALAAGALRDHGRAVLVGEDTEPEEMQAFEKVAQALPDGSTATVTVAYYRLPRGKALWKEALRADVEVPLEDPTVQATGKNGDPQFEKALQLLKDR